MSQITLLSAATATTSAPTAATDGVAMPHTTDLATLFVYSSAGSGTMTFTGRLWGYNTTLAKWFPLGPGADATKGTINGGTALGETGTDSIAHCEVLDSLFNIHRVYMQVVAIGGTSTAIEAVLSCPQWGRP
jgi:hypothetical protein